MTLMSLQKENSRGVQGAWKDRAANGLLEIHATAHFSGQQLGESIRSKLQNLDMRIQRSQNSLVSGDEKARWRAEISTCVCKFT